MVGGLKRVEGQHELSPMGHPSELVMPGDIDSHEFTFEPNLPKVPTKFSWKGWRPTISPTAIDLHRQAGQAVNDKNKKEYAICIEQLLSEPSVFRLADNHPFVLSLKAEQAKYRDIKLQDIAQSIHSDFTPLLQFSPQVPDNPLNIEPFPVVSKDYLKEARQLDLKEKANQPRYITYLSTAYIQYRFQDEDAASKIKQELERAQLAFGNPPDSYQDDTEKLDRMTALGEYIERLKKERLPWGLERDEYQALRDQIIQNMPTTKLTREEALKKLRTYSADRAEIQAKITKATPAVQATEKRIALFRLWQQRLEILNRKNDEFVRNPIESPADVSISLRYTQSIVNFSSPTLKEQYVESLIKAKQELGNKYPKTLAAIDAELIRCRDLLLYSRYLGRDELLKKIQTEFSGEDFEILQRPFEARGSLRKGKRPLVVEDLKGVTASAINLQTQQVTLLIPFIDWQPKLKNLQTWAQWWAGSAKEEGAIDAARQVLESPEYSLSQTFDVLANMGCTQERVNKELEIVQQKRSALEAYKTALEKLPIKPGVKEELDSVEQQLENIKKYLATEQESKSARTYFLDKLGGQSEFAVSIREKLKRTPLEQVYAEFAQTQGAPRILDNFLQAVFEQRKATTPEEQKLVLQKLARIDTPISETVKTKLIDLIQSIDSQASQAAKKALNAQLQAIAGLNDVRRQGTDNVRDYQSALIKLQVIAYDERKRIAEVATQLEELSETGSFDQKLATRLKTAVMGDEFKIDFATLSFERQLALHKVSSPQELAQKTIDSPSTAIQSLFKSLSNPTALASSIPAAVKQLSVLLGLISQDYPEIAVELGGDISHVNSILQGRGMAPIIWNRGTVQNTIRDALLGSRGSLKTEVSKKVLPASALLGIALLKSLPEIIRGTQAGGSSAESTFVGSQTKYWVGQAAGLIPGLSMASGLVGEAAGRAANIAMALVQTKAERNLANVMGDYRDTEVAINAVVTAASKTDNPLKMFKETGTYVARREAIQTFGDFFRATVEDGLLGYPKRKLNEFKQWLGLSSGTEKAARVGAGVVAGVAVGAGIYVAASVATGGILPLATAIVGGIVVLGVTATKVMRRFYPETSKKIDEAIDTDTLKRAKTNNESDWKDQVAREAAQQARSIPGCQPRTEEEWLKLVEDCSKEAQALSSGKPTEPN